MHAPRRQVMMHRQIEPTARSLRHWITASLQIHRRRGGSCPSRILLLPDAVRPAGGTSRRAARLQRDADHDDDAVFEALLTPRRGCRTPWWRCRRSTSSASRCKARLRSRSPASGAPPPPLAVARGEGDRAPSPYRSEASGETFALGPIQLHLSSGRAAVHRRRQRQRQDDARESSSASIRPIGRAAAQRRPRDARQRRRLPPALPAVFADFHLFEHLLGSRRRS